MEKFRLIFWKRSFNRENEFISEDNSCLTKAIITKHVDGAVQKFDVDLDHIGMKSKYGTFTVIIENNIHKTTTKDDAELNQLKDDIFFALVSKIEPL
jgi:hypothetical protein